MTEAIGCERAVLDQRAGERAWDREVGRDAGLTTDRLPMPESVVRGRAPVGSGRSAGSRITCRTASTRSGCTGQRWCSCTCCNTSRTADDSAHTRCTTPCRCPAPAPCSPGSATRRRTTSGRGQVDDHRSIGSRGLRHGRGQRRATVGIDVADDRDNPTASPHQPWTAISIGVPRFTSTVATTVRPSRREEEGEGVAGVVRVEAARCRCTGSQQDGRRGPRTGPALSCRWADRWSWCCSCS